MKWTFTSIKHIQARPGDVLVNEGGYGVGRCAVWEGQISPCYFQKSLHRIRVDSHRLAPRFVMHHLLWAKEQGHFDDITMTTTFQHLTGVRLKRYEILFRHCGGKNESSPF